MGPGERSVRIGGPVLRSGYPLIGVTVYCVNRWLSRLCIALGDSILQTAFDSVLREKKNDWVGLETAPSAWCLSSSTG